MQTFRRRRFFIPGAVRLGTMLACAVPALAVAQSQQGGEPGRKQVVDFDVQAEAGYLYDNNLGIDELDRASSEGDSALTGKLKADGRWRPADSLTISGGYQVTTRNYQDADAFDTLTRLANAGIEVDVSGYDVGATYHHAWADLNDEAFLELERPSVYVGKLIDNQWYWRLAATEQEKRFDSLPGRDADASSLGGDLFYFPTPENFWSVGLASHDEDARSDVYDYNGWQATLKWSQTLSWQGRQPRLVVSGQYDWRDYSDGSSLSSANRGDDGFFDDFPGAGSSAEDASAGAREDRIGSVRGELEIPLSDVFSVAGVVEYRDHSSNLDSADYDETLVGVTARARF